MTKQQQQRKRYLKKNDEVTSEDENIRRLIEERRNTARGEKQHLKEVSKQIRKCIRNKKRIKKKRYDESLKSSEASKTYRRRKRILIPIAKKDIGDTITSRKGISNDFAEFYSKLFADDGTEESYKTP